MLKQQNRASLIHKQNHIYIKIHVLIITVSVLIAPSLGYLF